MSSTPPPLRLGLHEVGSFVTNVVVSKWFVRMRGRAIALTSLSNQVGALFVVPLVAYLVANLGWRTAWQVLGVGLAIVLLPPISLFMRRMPEDMGLRPDGDPPYATPAAAPQTGERAAQPVAPLIAEPHWGPRDALRTRTTWLLIAANNTWSLSASVFLVHQLPYFMDSGLSLQAASFVVALNNLVTIFGKAIWGFVAERVPPRYCLTACYLLRGCRDWVPRAGYWNRARLLLRSYCRFRHRLRPSDSPNVGRLLRACLCWLHTGHSGALQRFCQSGWRSFRCTHFRRYGQLRRRIHRLHRWTPYWRSNHAHGQATRPSSRAGQRSSPPLGLFTAWKPQTITQQYRRGGC